MVAELPALPPRKPQELATTPAPRVAWLVWLRTWVETDEGRRIVPRLLGVCSSVTIALDLMVTGGDSTFAEQVAMDTILPEAPRMPTERDE